MPKQKVGDKRQLAAFRKAAREVGADQTSEYDFQKALRRIAKAKPSSEKDKQRRKNNRSD